MFDQFSTKDFSINIIQPYMESYSRFQDHDHNFGTRNLGISISNDVGRQFLQAWGCYNCVRHYRSPLKRIHQKDNHTFPHMRHKELESIWWFLVRKTKWESSYTLTKVYQHGRTQKSK